MQKQAASSYFPWRDDLEYSYGKLATRIIEATLGLIVFVIVAASVYSLTA